MSEEATQSRRKFLKGSLLAGGAAVAVTACSSDAPETANDAGGAVKAPHVAKKTTKLTMQGSWGSSAIFTDMAKQYIERVNKMSGGTLEIEYLPAGAIVKAFAVQDAVNDGALDAAHSVPAYWYGKNKAASLFGSGPIFGPNAHQMMAWLHYGGGKELYDELVQQILGLNITAFFAMPMPAQPLGWFKEHVTSADQMQGLKYRTVGLASDVMQGMGLKVTQLPGGEIVPALERGVIEAFEFNNPTSDRQFGAQDVSKHYHLGSYHQAIEYFEILFNKTKFDSLADEEKAILEYAAEAANTANYGLAMDRYSKDLDELVKQDGVNVHRTDESIMKAQLESWDVVMEDLIKDPFFKKVVDSQRKWAERVAFYDITNAADFKLAYEHHFPGKLKF